MDYKGIKIQRAGYTATVEGESATFNSLEDLKEWIDHKLFRLKYLSAVKEDMKLVNKFRNTEYSEEGFKETLHKLRTREAVQELWNFRRVFIGL